MAAPAPDPSHSGPIAGPDGLVRAGDVPEARIDAGGVPDSGPAAALVERPSPRRRWRIGTRSGIAVLVSLALAASLGAACTPTSRRPVAPTASPGLPGRAASSGPVLPEEGDGQVEQRPVAQPAALQQARPDGRLREDREVTPWVRTGSTTIAPFVPPGPASLTVPVLTYHQVTPTGTRDEYVVSPELFDAHLGALVSRGWRAITAHDLGILLATRGTPPEHAFVVTIDDGWQDGLSHALPVLQRYRLAATFYVVPGLVGTPGYLTWEEVRALRDAGMEIGNHTMHHARMTQLTADEAAHAVRDAQEIFRRELGDEPDTFAYPFGAFNATAVEAVRNAAVLLAFTTKSGTVCNWDGRLTIPRIHVGPGTTTSALLRAMGVLAVR